MPEDSQDATKSSESTPVARAKGLLNRLRSGSSSPTTKTAPPVSPAQARPAATVAPATAEVVDDEVGDDDGDEQEWVYEYPDGTPATYEEWMAYQQAEADPDPEPPTPGPAVETKPAAKPAVVTQPSTTTDARTAPKPPQAPEQAPEPAAAPETVAGHASEPDPHPELDLGLEPRTVPTPETERNAEVAPVPKTQREAEPEPEAEPEVAPEPSDSKPAETEPTDTEQRVEQKSAARPDATSGKTKTDETVETKTDKSKKSRQSDERDSPDQTRVTAQAPAAEDAPDPDPVEYHGSKLPQSLIGAGIFVVTFLAVIQLFRVIGDSGSVLLLILLVLVLAGLWASLLLWGPTEVSIADGQLDVSRGPKTRRVDLRDPDTKVELGEDPSARGWRAVVHHPERKLTLSGREVDAEEFSRIVHHHHSRAGSGPNQGDQVDKADQA